MEATARIELPEEKSLWEEFQVRWRSLPDKAIFGGLLAGWVLLFQFYGCVSSMAGHNHSLFTWMWQKWSDPSNDASHAKLIPFVTLYLLWARRERFARSCAEAWWPGLLMVAMALGLHVIGFVVQQPRFSMVALFSGAWGLIGLVWGWETLKLTFFPFFIFGFCVPVGGTFALGLTLQLRLMAANATAFVAHNLLDVDVVRAGTALHDPAGHWNYDVAAACSGIRSFVALLAISTIFSVLTMRKLWKRAVLILLTIPLSLICNIFRLTTIILASEAFQKNGDSEAAGRFVDAWFGYVTYAVAIGLLLLAGRLLKEKPSPTSS